jgi:hypothetical protein
MATAEYLPGPGLLKVGGFVQISICHSTGS